MIARSFLSLGMSLALASPPGAAVDLYVSPRGVQSVLENAIVNQVNGRVVPANDVRLQASRLASEDGRFRIQATVASTPATAIRVQVAAEQPGADCDRRPVCLRTGFVGPPSILPPLRMEEGRQRDLEVQSSEGRVRINFVPSELDIDIGHIDLTLDRAIQAEGVALDFRATRVRVKNLRIRSRGDLGIALSFGLDEKNQKISLEGVRQRLQMDPHALVIEPGDIVLIDENGNEKDAEGNAWTPQIPGLSPTDASEVSSQLSQALKAEFQRNKELIVSLATPKITEVMARTVKEIVAEEINPKLEEISRIGITQDMTWLVNGLQALPGAGLAAQYCLAGGERVARAPWVPSGAQAARDVSARLTRDDVNALLARFTGQPLQFGDMKITPTVPAQVRFGADGRMYARFEGDVEHPALANLQVEGSKVRGNVEVPVRLVYENGILKPFLDLPEDSTPVESTLSLRVPTRDRQSGATVLAPIDAKVRFTRVGNSVQARVVLDEGAVASLVNYAQTTGLVPTVLPMGQGRTAELIQPVQVVPEVRATDGPVASEGAMVQVRVPQVRVPIPHTGEMAQLRRFDDPTTGKPWEYVDLDLNLRAQARIEEVDGVQRLRVYLPPSRLGASNNNSTRGVRTARILNIDPSQANGLGAVANYVGADWFVSGEYAKETMHLEERVQEELSRRAIGTIASGRFSDSVRHPEGVLRHARSARGSDGEIRMKTQVLQLPTGGVQVTMTHPETGEFLGRYSFSATSPEGRMYLDYAARGNQDRGLRYRFTLFEDPPQSGHLRWNVEALDPVFRQSPHPPRVVQHIRGNIVDGRVEMTTHVRRSGDSGVRVRMMDAKNGAVLGEYVYSDTSPEGRMYLEHAAIHGATSPVQYRAIPAGQSYQLEVLDPNRDGRRPLFEFALDDPRAKPYLDLVSSAARTHAGAEVRVAQPTTSRASPEAERELAVGLDFTRTDAAPQVPLGAVNVESILNARIAERGAGIVPPIGNTELRIDPATGEVIFSGDFRRP